MQRNWKSLAIAGAIAYVLVALTAYYFSDRLIFPAPPSSYQDSEEILKVTTEDGSRLSALYLPNPLATYTILFAHGNGEDLGQARPFLQRLRRAGYGVFSYDYRGYGTSEGQARESTAYTDIEAIYEYLATQLAIPAERLIVYGYSIGGAIAIHLAARRSVAALVAQSTFTTAFRTVLPFPVLPFEKFPSIDKIPQVECPVLIIHGTADEAIPFAHGKRLFAAAPEPKGFLWVERAGHANLARVAGAKLEAALEQLTQLIESE